MTTELSISSDLSLPMDAVSQTFAILAKRGVGKTYTASVLTEEMLQAGLPVVVVDPIGVWWGLRASADGTHPGLSVAILGGDHGDVPLEVTAGEVVADLIVDEGLSAVLDLSLFRKGEQTRFMTGFAERLYHRNRRPLHLVLDEADAFAPQRPMKGQERLLGAIEDLVRRGRARGLGVTLVTQRAAVLNKDVLTQVEVLVALRTIAPQDRDAVDAWIRVHGTPEQREEMMSSLPSLPIGTAWFWSPGWLDLFQRVEVRRRTTFDSSATPKMGESLQPPKQLVDIDLSQLRDRMAATIEKVRTEDPRELRRRIAELEKQLRDRPAETHTETVVERVEVPVLSNGQLEGFREAVNELTEAGRGLIALGLDLGKIVEQVTHPLVSVYAPASPALPWHPTVRPVSLPALQRQPNPPPSGSVSVSLRAGERRMIEVLARHYPMRVTRAQLGTLSRFAPSGGTFSQYFSNLKRNGLVEESAGEVQITQAGFDVLGIGEPPAPQTTEELQSLWRSALRAGERTILDYLISIYPESVLREILGEQTGYTASGGTFGQYLGTLRRNGLVETDGQRVRASDTLFLGAGGN